jgi:hypothetical protein
MKTHEQILIEVAKKYGYESWHGLMYDTNHGVRFIIEAMQAYADQVDPAPISDDSKSGMMQINRGYYAGMLQRIADLSYTSDDAFRAELERRYGKIQLPDILDSVSHNIWFTAISWLKSELLKPEDKTNGT